MQIGMIGAGNMAEAMLTAWLRNGLVVPDDVILADVRPERLATLAATYGVRTTSDNHVLPAAVDVLVLGVKPQQMASVLDDLRQHADPRGLVVSIAAGKRLAWLEERLPAARVVRVMPNIACRVGQAMSVYSPGRAVGETDCATVTALLGAFGRVMALPDDAMDVVTAVSGSGPAFFARMVQAMARSAAGQTTMSADQALCLAAQTMQGAAALILEGGMSPEQLIAAVSSARGTTVAGLEAMDELRFDDIIETTVDAATRRSRELAATPLK